MTDFQYLYNVNHTEYEESLCAIEKRALFDCEPEGKVFFSNVKVNPSVSPFIKSRLQVKYRCSTYDEILNLISKDETIMNDFNVKYLKLVSGDEYAAKRNSLCKEIIETREEAPNYKSPSHLYGITHYNNEWIFGPLEKNNKAWMVHDKRPYTYSNSLKMTMAKVLINLAGRGDTTKTIIDPCCGAGTVLLEGCFSGYKITGSDISWKTARNARENLAHFAYSADVYKRAIEDIEAHYDASIVDLPYGLYSKITPEQQLSIIQNAIRISRRMVIIASQDISEILSRENVQIVDKCEYIKSVNREFTRYIYVCERVELKN